ncbi:MAG: ribonucleoside-triphosphate reductase [Candidatus Yonathbacteria bacterium CG_4_10_14_3_um_filter_47_65]|uniref:Ribonucleoside-triphosphate reductase n=2 Tax=Parcubacteria group TaxID=1794811 RepID=A0A2M8D835_9BACT|nr:MAG: ribonucleoside-triphosphate reductase [Candidatus Nomurabacteria bacterium CG1_02_47_685]PIP04129.1 MAG: ribonucleoside-triphosphate reductase [Candidatus Yonathbacteria bacterium CG23_combo_of_CG06-09_8_20_14_all_46_18]PIQ31262.1 MAG: ribonucleoside-triphosphate reductase [Candidatus Yonathbacteria bacterium CG17_big_fil_post_rev_8_21_14_2_50_46_19]PIX56515.1 MAG: ribonucleoside-triphosphate reductase [Candidatus Yonathbacteria bacterium CG_4_10_14_3_um_filter_47_65]PJB83320.1 MAG: rib
MVKPSKSSGKAHIFLKNVRKRDGSLAHFDVTRVSKAVSKAMQATGEGTQKEAEYIGRKIVSELKRIDKLVKDFVPTVEGIQDLVERELILEDFVKTAKAYILYREERTKVRKQKGEIPEKVRKLTREGKKYFRNILAEFVYYRTYSRWIDEEGRRETWIETVDRYMDFMKENIDGKLSTKEYAEIREGILKHEAMPSMRLLQFAGDAARRTNVCAYNCSYVAPTKLQDFGEIMYILMCGSGVGFAVESQNVQTLPQIKAQTGEKLPTHVIPDSKEGWADTLVLGMKTWFDGKDIDFDYSKLRPAGARLKVMGGRSSGPDPLRSVMKFTREKILKRQGRRLSNLDVHDIVCKIGEVVVAGGVRRSALISLSDLDDQEIRDAKKGQFYINEPQRMMANNSAVYITKPTNTEFLDEWVALMKSGSGERGIFNRSALAKTLPARRLEMFGGDTSGLGSNPCGEIILQSKQFCNLSEVVVRPEDTEISLLRKVRLATILGTYQSSLTHFPYLSKEWKQNCDNERLLGVSLTGQWDCPAVRDAKVLQRLRDETVKVNKAYAKKFSINPSTCVTSVKPSGTLSQMVDCASGMHPRHSAYYIRRIRISATDPLFMMLKDQGIPHHPEVGQSRDTANTYVLEFPVKAPEGSIFKNDVTALDQLEHWKLVKQNYTEHNPSVTVSVGDDEWVAVANWLYSNWEIIGGLSFLPRNDFVYQLAPYEEITKEQYEELLKKFNDIDFAKIVTYEKQDATEVAKELACVAGTCEIV